MAITIAIIFLIFLSSFFSAALQSALEPHFADQASLSDLRSFFRTIGGALIGAAAIAFALVMFAMQVNVERLPHGLFRKFSSDWRIKTAFIGTFLLAIIVACVSFIPNRSWIAIAVLVAAWGTIMVFVLFLYAYRRALLLINPTMQLSLIVKDAATELRVWARRAERAKPFFENPKDEDDDETTPFRWTHDTARTAYFQVNQHWASGAKRAIQYAMSFARRFAETGDHEVSEAALNAVVLINSVYVVAKGKTFFGNLAFVTNQLSTDGFINETLEHLRQNVRVGVARGDERQIEQTLHTMANLVPVYAEIDYSNPYASKTHALLAAGYLSEAVQSVAPHNFPDVVMEGVRLMGQSALHFLVKGDPNDIPMLSDKISLVACIGIANENYRPVTLVGVEQIAMLTIALLKTKAPDFGFAAKKLSDNMSFVAKLFLAVPDTPLANTHSTYLAPYYSATSTDSLQSWLTDLANALVEAKAGDEVAQTIIQNIEDWADGLFRPQKELLLLAIDKRSNFTFDIVYWISHITKLLLAISNAAACDDHTKAKLQNHALWLISTLSFVPDDKDSVSFTENFQMTEKLFEAALDSHQRDCGDISEKMLDLLFGWAFKAGKFQTGWGIFERALYGLAVLALLTESAPEIERLKKKMSERLIQPDSPSQELRDATAGNIRDRAATLYREGHWSSRIEYAMAQADQNKLRALLEDMANMLSPDTKTEPVEIDQP